LIFATGIVTFYRPGFWGRVRDTLVVSAFVADAAYMTQKADVAHVVGEAVSRHGVKPALHTESNSTL